MQSVVKMHPLKVAFANTYHALQGISCQSNIDVDPEGWTKEDGRWVPLQAGAYVALSRAVDVGLVKLTRPLEQRHVRANAKVAAWYSRAFGPE